MLTLGWVIGYCFTLRARHRQHLQSMICTYRYVQLNMSPRPSTVPQQCERSWRDGAIDRPKTDLTEHRGRRDRPISMAKVSGAVTNSARVCIEIRPIELHVPALSSCAMQKGDANFRNRLKYRARPMYKPWEARDPRRSE